MCSVSKHYLYIVDRFTRKRNQVNRRAYRKIVKQLLDMTLSSLIVFFLLHNHDGSQKRSTIFPLKKIHTTVAFNNERKRKFIFMLYIHISSWTWTVLDMTKVSIKSVTNVGYRNIINLQKTTTTTTNVIKRIPINCWIKILWSIFFQRWFEMGLKRLFSLYRWGSFIKRLIKMWKYAKI